MAQVIRTGRGVVLVYGGFMFHRNRMRAQTIYWKCGTRGCPSRLRTNVFEFNDSNTNNNNVHVEHVSLHNHMVENNRIERQLVVNEMVSTIQANPNLVPRRDMTLLLITRTTFCVKTSLDSTI